MQPKALSERFLKLITAPCSTPCKPASWLRRRSQDHLRSPQSSFHSSRQWGNSNFKKSEHSSARPSADKTRERLCSRPCSAEPVPGSTPHLHELSGAGEIPAQLNCFMM
ncbi:hypothetical protein NDU88_007172, partial [Pleurodeles waltl]